MAYKEQRTRYESFSDIQKASMILLLEQFPDHMETINIIRESIKVPGAFLLDTYEAVILAAIIRPYWPDFADRLMAPLESYPSHTPDEAKIAHGMILDRLRGVPV